MMKSTPQIKAISWLSMVSMMALLAVIPACRKEQPPVPKKSYFRAEIDGVLHEFEFVNSPDYNYRDFYAGSLEWIHVKGTPGDFIISIHNVFDTPYIHQYDTASWLDGTCQLDNTCHEKFYVFYRPANNAMNWCNTTNPYSKSANIQYLTTYGTYPIVDHFPRFYFEESNEKLIKAFFNGSLLHVCSMDSLNYNFINITNLSFELYREEFEY